MTGQALTPRQLGLTNSLQQMLAQQQQQQTQFPISLQQSKHTNSQVPSNPELSIGVAQHFGQDGPSSYDHTQQQVDSLVSPLTSNQQQTSMQQLKQLQQTLSMQQNQQQNLMLDGDRNSESLAKSLQPDPISGLGGQGDANANDLMSQYRQLFGASISSANTDSSSNVNSTTMLDPSRAICSSGISPAMAQDDGDLSNIFDDVGPLQMQSSLGSLHVGLQQQQALSQQLQMIQPLPLKHPDLSTASSISQAQLTLNSLQSSSTPRPLQGQMEQPNQSRNSDSFLLPSTMVPPSVLASVYGSAGGGKKESPYKAGKTVVKRKRPKPQTSITPQAYLEQLVQQQGHTYHRVTSEIAEYDAAPSALQLASFGTHLVRAVHTSDAKMLTQLLDCGLSPNPCNQFRDSVIDLVCKRANFEIFNTLLTHGCDLQVVDGFGRTPLHHACWASSFSPSIVEVILERDPIQLCIEDKHGQTPLEYVRSDLAGEWVEFLEKKVLAIYPTGGSAPQLKSPKSRRPDGTLRDPSNSISVSLAALVSAGSVTPTQVGKMDEVTRKTYKSK